ncbi:MAG TPA: ATP-binding protein [Candidatus Obscuribacterales bacterium]
MQINLRLSQQALVLIAVPLLFAVAFAATLYSALNQAQTEVMRADWARRVAAGKSKLTKCMVDTQAGMLNFMWTGDRNWLTLCRTGVDTLPERFRELAALVSEQEQTGRSGLAAQARLVEYRDLFRQLLDKLERREQPDAAFLSRLKDSSRALAAEVRKLTAHAQSIEQASPSLKIESRKRVLALLSGGFVANAVLAIALVVYFNRGAARRFANLMDNIGKIRRREALPPAMSGRDEMAQLDGVFHEMVEALEIAQRKERAVIENAADVICSIGPDFKFQSVSPACRAVWKRGPDELSGQPFESILQEACRSASLATLAGLKNGPDSGSFETRVALPDGTVIDMLWSARWSQDEQAFFCVAHDITARKVAEDLIKASQARIRLVIESMPVGIALLDERGVIEMVNPFLAKLFAADDGLAGRQFSTLIAAGEGDSDTPTPARLRAELGSGAGELAARRSNGETFPAELSLAEFSLGNRRRWLVIMRDVSERQAALELRQQFREMIKANLQIPLASIRRLLTELSDSPPEGLSERGVQRLKLADRNADRLVLLVNDLADLERLDAGQFNLNLRAASVSSIIARAVECVRPDAEKRKLSIEVSASEAEIFADPDRLVQVLVNLLSNAIKFSPDSAVITVSATATNQWLEFQVRDRGPGIPAAQRDLIFERFHQVDLADARERKGTGLGLAICKALIQQHGGQIGVDSEPLKGSTFWFRIPTGCRQPRTVQAGA